MTMIDAACIARLLAVEPELAAVSPASQALGLGPRQLLHAGPPITDRSSMAKPIMNSAVAAILFEGWESDADRARELLLSPAIELASAQDHGAALPLADVLSPSMQVLEVEDRACPGRAGFSTINGGDGPVMRVGVGGLAVVERLRWVNGPLAQTLAELLAARRVPLLPIARQALAGGDDLHGRTAQASRILVQALSTGLRSVPAEQQAFLDGAAAFFLNAWMAACKCLLQAVAESAGASVISQIGSNGKEFGIQVAGLPGRWFTAPASAPLIPGATDLGRAPASRALGAIGDSAIIDALGFGAMAAAHVPETAVRLRRVLDEHRLAEPLGLLDTPHPAFRDLPGFRTGLTARRVCERSTTPVISLGVLDRLGELGRLDGGFFFSPIAPFQQARDALQEQTR